MIAVIRITGDVNLNSDIRETLNRLKLRRKYACVVLEGSKVNLGMVKKLRSFVAYGNLNETTHKKLVEKRKTKIKNFFRLHPPIKGID